MKAVLPWLCSYLLWICSNILGGCVEHLAINQMVRLNDFFCMLIVEVVVKWWQNGSCTRLFLTHINWMGLPWFEYCRRNPNRRRWTVEGAMVATTTCCKGCHCLQTATVPPIAHSRLTTSLSWGQRLIVRPPTLRTMDLSEKWGRNPSKSSLGTSQLGPWAGMAQGERIETEMR